MMTTNMETIWDVIVSYDIATNEELSLACDLCGTSEETLNKVLYARTGYRDIEQMIEATDEEDGE